MDKNMLETKSIMIFCLMKMLAEKNKIVVALSEKYDSPLEVVDLILNSKYN